MYIQDRTIKPSRIVKRPRISHAYNSVTAKNSHTRGWIATGICLAVISLPYIGVAASTGQLDAFALLVLGTIAGVIIGTVYLYFLAWGWRITLDLDKTECVFRRTYAGLVYRTTRFSLIHGYIGPHPIHMEWAKGENSFWSVVAMGLLLIFGPIGFIISLIFPLRRPENTHIVERPGIIHYNEQLDEVTVLLVLDEATQRDRILTAFAEIVPQSVSTR